MNMKITLTSFKRNDTHWFITDISIFIIRDVEDTISVVISSLAFRRENYEPQTD